MLDKACGVDVHRDVLVATIVGDAWKRTRSFENSMDGINSLKAWLKEQGCGRVAMESSGVFWVPLYSALEDGFEVVLANARQVKAIPGRKTDMRDSEWLAQLLRSGLIKPSYVPERHLRELRELTRLRVKLVDTKTAFKNRCHKVLNRVNIRLGSRLSDVFGKAGIEILEGLMEGKTIDKIIEQSRNKRLKKRKDEIVEVVKGSLSQVDVFILKECVDEVKHLDKRIRRVDARIQRLVNKDDAKLIAKIPGVGKTSAAVITAEIGDPKRFKSGKDLASWAGLAPSVYQSAGKSLTGRITKRGSKWLRRIMVQVAHAAIKVRDSKLRRFYVRVKARKGAKTAIVALARKILTIIHHLLLNGEEYVEDGFEKRHRFRGSSFLRGLSLEDMATVLRDSGYLVKGPFG